MILLLFGAPGTGKSTYANYLSSKTGLTWVSTGNLFRQIAQTNPRIRRIQAAGDLIPDQEVDQVLRSEFDRLMGKFILDGYPRTLNQMTHFLDYLKSKDWQIDHVFHLNVPIDVVTKRMLVRGRDDDTANSVRNRFQIFEDQTKPVIAHFESLGIPVTEIDNTPSIDEVKKQFDQYLSR